MPASRTALLIVIPLLAGATSLDIVAHLPLSGGPVVHFTMTHQGARHLLYAEHTSHVLSLLDVTDVEHPKIDGHSESASLLAASGDAALITSDPPALPPTAGKSLTLVSFADPAHPKTLRQFRQVTCTAVDDARGLVFLANHEGLWILRRNSAADKEAQERYAHEVLYNH